jgi:hypothetical protein
MTPSEVNDLILRWLANLAVAFWFLFGANRCFRHTDETKDMLLQNIQKMRLFWRLPPRASRIKRVKASVFFWGSILLICGLLLLYGLGASFFQPNEYNQPLLSHPSKTHLN